MSESKWYMPGTTKPLLIKEIGKKQVPKFKNAKEFSKFIRAKLLKQKEDL